MPLLLAWLNELHDVVQTAQHDVIEDLEDDSPLDWVEMEMATIMWAFHSRMLELSRVWRQQRMSVSVQVDSFCGGIFRTWYENVGRSR